MATEHTIRILPNDDGTPVPYNPIAHGQWVEVDGKDRYFLICDEDKIDEAIAQLYEQLSGQDAPPSTVKRYRKIAIKMALADLGLLPALNAWLASFEVKPDYTAFEAWNDANELATDYPGFDQFLVSAQQVLGVDSATVAAVLSQSEVED